MIFCLNAVIVALEQNMLEADVIRIDLEKIMAVLLTVVFQVYNLRIRNIFKEKHE